MLSPPRRRDATSIAQQSSLPVRRMRRSAVQQRVCSRYQSRKGARKQVDQERRHEIGIVARTSRQQNTVKLQEAVEMYLLDRL